MAFYSTRSEIGLHLYLIACIIVPIRKNDNLKTVSRNEECIFTLLK